MVSIIVSIIFLATSTAVIKISFAVPTRNGSTNRFCASLSTFVVDYVTSVRFKASAVCQDGHVIWLYVLLYSTSVLCVAHSAYFPNCDTYAVL